MAALHPQADAIRAMALIRIAEDLAQHRAGLEPVLSRRSLSLAQLKDPYALLPLHDYVQIFEELAALTARPALGAMMGQSHRPADIGPVGILFSLSASPAKGFERLGRLLAAFQSGTSAALVRDGAETAWVYKLSRNDIWPRRQDAEYAISATCAMVRSLRGTSWSPIEVQFEHEAPTDPQILLMLRNIFRCPISFGHAANALVMDSTEVDQPCHREDAALIAVLERHLADLHSQTARNDCLRQRVEAALDLLLGQRSVTLPLVASTLGIPARTLQRRLNAQGLTLRDMLRERRLATAEHRLRQGGTTIGQMAQRLGYADPTSFSRAYRHWTGDAPSRRRA
ncbi:AraC family transcriptional regulator [Novosphingobium terrae]|uniref:AraC family transcriptional regulator n=1 Tax=Novosphingobium terrae TaxID=2726189 RepID=UPI001980E5BE|nr:AraC family transcriptional regulator [Novosphingobium terrae]